MATTTTTTSTNQIAVEESHVTLAMATTTTTTSNQADTVTVIRPTQSQSSGRHHSTQSQSQSSSRHSHQSQSQSSARIKVTSAQILSDAQLAAVTVEEAGKLLDEVGHAPGKPLSNGEIGRTVGGLCRSELQLGRCLKIGITVSSACTGRCCIDVCKFWFHSPSKFASCNLECVKKTKTA